MTRLQPIYDIAQLCSLKGLSQAIVCPGSRCAPLTLAFVNHPGFKTRTISDERSAAFIATGIAQQTSTPVVLVCTSGSAAYNFAPAVAEAYYQRIPLIILTADRPTEWIDQWDGQTIQQEGLYGKHVKKSFQLPEAERHVDVSWHINRIVNEAVNLSKDFPCGPVHINVPLREPLYLQKNESIKFSESTRVIERMETHTFFSEEQANQLIADWNGFSKIAVVAGQDNYNDRLAKVLERFIRHQKVALVGDLISNVHSIADTIRYADSFLGQCPDSVNRALQPELLVTFGKSVISKNLKLFLRQNKSLKHWHIQPKGDVPDTFQSLNTVIESEPEDFFELLMNTKSASEFELIKRQNFYTLWEAEEHRAKRAVGQFFEKSELHELSLLQEVITKLPARCNIHLANSMSVRYANFIGLEAGKKGIRVFANRGTSGIDGCTSTAVGHALSSEVPNFLITGDLAFFYDRNAFWHNYALPNFRVVILNNHGGIIFNLIDGPENAPELQEFFITNQKLTAKNLCGEFGFDYLKIESARQVKNALVDFFTFDGKTKILELEGTQKVNKNAFEKFKKHIKSTYQ
jgi:2-succinyl-5-enolpyruvyl-6-hydroxy-3-cyclohexene-1-carboxylate synthase